MKHFDDFQIGHSPYKGQSVKVEKNISDDRTIEIPFSHRHLFYAIYWIHEGVGIHVVDFENYDITPNKIFFIKPEQVHFLDSKSRINYSALQFTDDFMLSFSSWNEGNFDIPVYLNLDVEEVKRFQTIFDMMYNEVHSSLPLSSNILQLEISILMLELNRMNGGNDRNQIVPEVILKYKNLVNQHINIYRQVSDYASLLNITPNYLNVLTQRHLGYSALSIINKRIILEIKRQLLTSDDDVSTIAYNLKFNELSYFSRFFKHHTGTTPSEFRISMNKMYQK